MWFSNVASGMALAALCSDDKSTVLGRGIAIVALACGSRTPTAQTPNVVVAKRSRLAEQPTSFRICGQTVLATATEFHCVPPEPVGPVLHAGAFVFRPRELSAAELTQPNDAGLAQLARCATLRWLHLHNTKVTDIGIARLSKLTNLRGIDLSFTTITDAALPHLATLTQLSKIRLFRSGVTEAGVHQLRRERGLPPTDQRRSVQLHAPLASQYLRRTWRARRRLWRVPIP